jgi:hypothetical protein
MIEDHPTTLPPELSPAAQAVLDAFNSGFNRPVAVHLEPRLAAALKGGCGSTWRRDDRHG